MAATRESASTDTTNDKDKGLEEDYDDAERTATEYHKPRIYQSSPGQNPPYIRQPDCYQKLIYNIPLVSANSHLLSPRVWRSINMTTLFVHFILNVYNE